MVFGIVYETVSSITRVYIAIAFMGGYFFLYFIRSEYEPLVDDFNVADTILFASLYSGTFFLVGVILAFPLVYVNLFVVFMSNLSYISAGLVFLLGYLYGFAMKKKGRIVTKSKRTVVAVLAVTVIYSLVALLPVLFGILSFNQSASLLTGIIWIDLGFATFSSIMLAALLLHTVEEITFRSFMQE